MRTCFVLMIFLCGGCLRTSDGGCGGPSVGEPCRCEVGGKARVSETPNKQPPVDDSTPRGGTVVVHAEVEPPHLMYLLRPDAWCERIVFQDVYESLIRQNPFTHEYQPALAESFDVSEDGLNLTFKLRKGVTWHDGQPFSADDVIFTFDTIRDPSVPAPSARDHFESVESYEVIDDSTVKLKLKHKSYYILQHLESIVMIPRHIFSRGDISTHKNLRHPIGTGPFKFVEYKTNERVVLERFDGYWGQKAKLDRVIYRFARDRTLALQMLRRGDIDIMPRLTTAQIDQVETDAELTKTHELRTFVAPGYSFLAFNTKRPQLADPAVRRAIAQLIDRPTILCALENCLGQIISHPFPVGHPGADPAIEPWQFSPRKAAKLLESRGWKRSGRGNILQKEDLEMNITFLMPSASESSHRVATLMQQDMLRIGVKLDIHVVDWAVFLQRLNHHDFDLAMLQFSMGWETDYYDLYHSSQIADGANYGSWSNAEVDELLEDLRVELDETRRIKMHQELHRILHRELPHAYIFARTFSTLSNRSIKNVEPGIPWYDERLWYIPEKARGKKGRPIR